MTEIENEILSLLMDEEPPHFKLLQKIIDFPLGTLNPEFFQNPVVQDFSQTKPLLAFRFALENYLHFGKTPELLIELERRILNLPGPLGPGKGLYQNKSAGTYLRPLSHHYILNIFALNDPGLELLMQKHFPLPPAHLFAADKRPQWIIEKTLAESVTISKTPKPLHFFALQAQRKFRKHRRNKEEVERISYRYKDYLSTKRISAKDLMENANAPYRPDCNPELQARILHAANQIKGFQTVKHITAKATLNKILDDALYGRRNLLDFYIEFKPASLYPSDVLNGDGNVICLGPQEIDPRATGEICIEFDVDKLIANQGSCFFKQLDLEFQTEARVRQVKLKDITLYFDQSSTVRCGHPDFSYLQFFSDSYRSLTHVAYLPKPLLIAYNKEAMHAILCLNFFRFLDQVRDLRDKSAQEYAEGIYQKIATLNDEELKQFLEDLERKISDTAEFNFYGAHRIDFTTVTGIWRRDTGFKLEFATFIAALNLGDKSALAEAIEAIPELFCSHRFLDYLLSQVSHAELVSELLALNPLSADSTVAAVGSSTHRHAM